MDRFVILLTKTETGALNGLLCIELIFLYLLHTPYAFGLNHFNKILVFLIFKYVGPRSPLLSSASILAVVYFLLGVLYKGNRCHQVAVEFWP